MISIAIEKREPSKKHNASLRKAGKIPAVLYGPKEKAAAIAVDFKPFEKALKEAGESSVVILTGVGPEKQALIQEIYRDPLTGTPRHADFYVIEKGQKVKVKVPIVFEGVSAAVKAGAVLVKVLHEIEVEAEAMHLPHEVKIDIAKLSEVGSHLTAADIVLANGVALVTKADEIVALAAIAKEEVEESAPIDLASIEVEEKGKKEVPGEGDAEAGTDAKSNPKTAKAEPKAAPKGKS
jgi:large subunit ribosomal protein L25